MVTPRRHFSGGHAYGWLRSRTRLSPYRLPSLSPTVRTQTAGRHLAPVSGRRAAPAANVCVSRTVSAGTVGRERAHRPTLHLCPWRTALPAYAEWAVLFRDFASKSRHKKTRVGGGLLSSTYCFTAESGGYGWTRTTDPSIMSAVLRLIGLYESVVRAVMSIQPLIGCRPTCLISRACFLIARWTTAGTSGPEASARVSPPSQGNGAQRGPRLGTQPIFNQIRVGGAS